MRPAGLGPPQGGVEHGTPVARQRRVTGDGRGGQSGGRGLCEVDAPFAGKLAVLGGDARQTLPVMPHASRVEQTDASARRAAVLTRFPTDRFTRPTHLDTALFEAFAGCSKGVPAKRDVKYWGGVTNPDTGAGEPGRLL